jgi:hypothetical protein
MAIETQYGSESAKPTREPLETGSPRNSGKSTLPAKFLKVGAKVTIYYTMVAAEVEVKAAKEGKGKK